MNIQQLNNSGKSIQTFLVTAVVILLLTGFAWMCVEGVNACRTWSRGPKPSPYVPQPRPNHTMPVRVYILAWLICHGHWTWARKTKAWREILANSRPDRYKGFASRMTFLPAPDDGSLTAIDYVTKYMYRSDGPIAFRLNCVRKKWKGRASEESE